MTLEQLRIFVAVAERQHVTQAARDMNLAQSAASHAIALLEARYDTRLFDRIGRRIALTEAGRTFLADAQTVLAQAERAEQTLEAFGRQERGTLTIQASQTIAGYWLPRHLAAFRRRWPRIAIRLGIGNTAEAADAVEAGTAELGFVEGIVDSPSLISTPVARDQLILVVGPEHPWTSRAEVPSAGLTELNLADSEWVLRERGSGTRSVFEEALVHLGLPPDRLNVVLELPSNEAVRAAVEAGLGATVISASVAAPSIEAGLLRHVPFRLPERRFYALRHRQRSGGKLVEAMMAMLPEPRA